MITVTPDMDKDRMDYLREKVSLLPSDPGVYRFLDSEGTVIYVGKAKNLKKRVSSYFVASRQNENRKLQALVRKIADIKHIVVATETDALLLENNLIKNLKPKYNILLKDDKTYPWICIRNEPFPRLLTGRRVERDGSRYFGPYSSTYVQRQLMELVRKVYSLRPCSLNLHPENIKKGKYSVCLEYHIGNCKAPCVGYQSEEEYDRNIRLAADLLRGNIREALEYLETEMAQAAAEMRFEEAQKCKEQIDVIKTFQIKTVIVNASLTNLDVFSLIVDEGTAFCNFMRVKDGGIINSLTIEMKLGMDEDPKDILTFAMSQIEETIEGKLCREVVVPFLPNTEIFPGVTFTVPKKGDKLKLLELSEKNGRVYKIEKLKYIEKVNPEHHAERIMAKMQKDLYLGEPPRHIECFDNSNIQGTNPVASCVVFRDGKPSRKEYRHFNIKTVVGANDFASMEEVVTRRYTRLLDEGGELPQLIVVDGGKGQLSFAYNTLKKLGLENRIAIIGLAKRYEEVFFPNDSVPHYLDKSSETLKVLMHIRDEAHRFGITFHRQKRSLNFIKSELEQVPGLGQKSIEKLLKKFRSISKIRAASTEDLAGIVGMHRAQALKAYFAEAEEEEKPDDTEPKTALRSESH